MKNREINLENIKWSQPLSLKQWCDVFGIEYKNRNTLANWFKNQTIRNDHISRGYWRVHIEDLPAEYITAAMLAQFQQKKSDGKNRK